MGVSTSRTEGYQANELSDATLNTNRGSGTPSTLGTTTDENQNRKLPLTEAETVQPDEQVASDDDAQKVQMDRNKNTNVNRNGEEGPDDMAGGYGNSSGSQHQPDGDETNPDEDDDDEEFGKSNDNDELDFDDDKIRKDNVEA